MKKKLAVFTIIPLLILGFLIYKNQKTSATRTLGQENVTSEMETTPNAVSFTLSDQEISVSLWKANPWNLKLIPNFIKKQGSKEFGITSSCKYLANAGFYSKENNPIGLFITNGETIGKWQENNLLDGILTVNELMTPRITRVVPRDSLNIAVQTGPIIKENGSFITLKIMNDSLDRRSVAGITGENELYFLSFYEPNSNYSGPLLADLPTALKTFEEKTGIVFADAINLDGGSASVFKNNNTSLEEITPVGAFFCQL